MIHNTYEHNYEHIKSIQRCTAQQLFKLHNDNYMLSVHDEDEQQPQQQSQEHYFQLQTLLSGQPHTSFM